MTVEQKSIVMGIDAGGTSTKVMVGSLHDLRFPDAQALARLTQHNFPAGNFRQLQRAGADALISKLMQHFNLPNLKNVSCFAGFAGASGSDARQTLTGLFKQRGAKDHNLIVTSDAGMLLHAFEGPGIALIAGTGSICVGTKERATERIDDTMYRAGGHGYLVGDEGSGYYMGRRAINALLNIEDGVDFTNTALLSYVLEYFSAKDLHEVSAMIYDLHAHDPSACKTKIAGLAFYVSELAAQHDPLCVSIIKDASHSLAAYVAAVATRMHGHSANQVIDVSVGLHGGVFKQASAPFMLELMKQYLHERRINATFFSLGLGIGENDINPLVRALRNNFVPTNEAAA